MSDQERTRLILTRSIGDRILVAVFCIILTFFFTLICLGIGLGRPKDSTEWLWQDVAFEVFLAFDVFTALGVVWAFFTPKWVEGLLQSAYRKTVFVISVVAVTSLCTALYFAFAR